MARTVVIFYCLVCLGVTELVGADPNVDVKPTEISEGLSEWLDVNCSFSIPQNPDMAALVSLIVSRASSAEEPFTELASISDVPGHQVNQLTSEKVKTTGVLDPAGVSWLSLQWEYPEELQGGVYKCSAQGFDSIGHLMLLPGVTQVLVKEPSFDEWKSQVMNLTLYSKNLEQMIMRMSTKMDSLEETIQELKRNDSHVVTSVESLEQKVSWLEQEPLNNISAMFEQPLTYKNHTYYVSKQTFVRIDVSNTICNVFGGYLVEINDESEYLAITNFLKTSTAFPVVYIAGSDDGHEGSWVLPFSNTPLPYENWAPGKPSSNSFISCLCLYSAVSWQMWDRICYDDPPSSTVSFMCEIPHA